MPYRLGRRPRGHDHRIPRYGALLGTSPLPEIPASVDYTTGLPAFLGVMNNDRLGCCTISALYHALQVWSYNAGGTVDTEPDADVLTAYEQACGYNPADPSTDQGGVEQDVLAWAMNTGLPVGPSGADRHKIAAYPEIDPKRQDHIKAAVYLGGVAYLGIDLPAYIMSSGPPAVWDVDPSGDNSIIGGHAIILAGYDDAGAKLISWGTMYTATWAFLEARCDEAYAPIDAEWIRATGLAPCGLTLPELEAAMTSLKEPG